MLDFLVTILKAAEQVQRSTFNRAPLPDQKAAS
jgi:hypothetical protein